MGQRSEPGRRTLPIAAGRIRVVPLLTPSAPKATKRDFHSGFASSASRLSCAHLGGLGGATFASALASVGLFSFEDAAAALSDALASVEKFRRDSELETRRKVN